MSSQSLAVVNLQYNA